MAKGEEEDHVRRRLENDVQEVIGMSMVELLRRAQNRESWGIRNDLPVVDGDDVTASEATGNQLEYYTIY